MSAPTKWAVLSENSTGYRSTSLYGPYRDLSMAIAQAESYAADWDGSNPRRYAVVELVEHYITESTR